MSNYDLYSQILESDAEYWCVAKQTSYRDCFETKRGDDEILFIAVPHQIKTGQKKEDIKFTEVNALKHLEIPCNIHLSSTYTPFQSGQTFYSIYKGFPIKTEVRLFFEEAVKLKSKDLWDYEKLYKELTTTLNPNAQ